jgi:hypothetical protein
MLSVVALTVVMLSTITYSVVMLRGILLNAAKASVILVIVVAPFFSGMRKKIRKFNL